MKYFIGIDPGISGGLTWLDKNGDLKETIVMPTVKVGTKNALDIKAIAAWLKKIMTEDLIKMVAIEQQRPMHKIGEVATFAMGRGFGLLEGIVSTLQLPYRVIRAVDWQKEMFMGLPKGKGMTKAHSKLMAQQLYPKESFLKTERCTNIHDGLTDATLIAEYIRRVTK